jgi:anaerobic ribonucleoside-triphosphate reductase activating protein
MYPLTISRKKAICKVLGPGERSVIWFHGCSRRCSNCIADTMNDSADYEQILPSELANWVMSSAGIEGVTLSGGEPLQQPAAELTEFLMLVKRNSDLSVLCYTGYQYEDISDDEKYSTILPLIDVLIDGEYRQEEEFGHRWRGSANQRFHFLTDRYRVQQEEWNDAFERQIEMELDINSKLLVSGVPSKDFIKKLTGALHQRGVDIIFHERGAL